MKRKLLVATMVFMLLGCGCNSKPSAPKEDIVDEIVFTPITVKPIEVVPIEVKGIEIVP